MSKIALIELVNLLIINEFNLIDCQIETNHLTSLGARCISRTEFETRLRQSISHENPQILVNFSGNMGRLT
jgi:leucyl/phenylalanyl-tRNA--protein transferase